MIDFSGSYCGAAPVADQWWRVWNDDPVLLAALAVAGMAAFRLDGQRRRCGLAAVGVLALAFVSPLCALTTALFAARSVHHLLLIAAAGPLLALAWPMRLRGGIMALVAMTVALWLWHVPPLYDAALGNQALYWVMQWALLAASWWFWSSMFVASVPGAVAGLAGAAGQMGMLGALLTFAPRPLYATHFATTASYGIGPLGDQQLAGLLMWVPGMVPFALAAGWIASRRWRTPAVVAA